MKLVAVNGTDRDWTKHRYILWFGSHDPSRLMVWANSLDVALDLSVDWLADHAPGVLCDDAVAEQYRAALAAGKSEEEAREEAEVDTTCAGNCGNYLPSDAWGLLAEDPTRAEVLSVMAEE